MPRFQSSRDVPFTPRQMYDLVADVESYPQFLPLCEDLRIRRKVLSTEGLDVLVADMTVGYKSIHETFTTRVTLDPAQQLIFVTYLEGPFSHLDNRWQFLPDDKGCKVVFYIDYEFRSRMFDRAFRKFSEAFEARAALIYKKSDIL